MVDLLLIYRDSGAGASSASVLARLRSSAYCTRGGSPNLSLPQLKEIFPFRCGYFGARRLVDLRLGLG
jgi:hypothetical protein